MKTSDFSFKLPEELIAQSPPPVRGTSRMMVLRAATGRTEDARVSDLAGYLAPGTVVVLNDTRVRKARLYGRAEGGGGRVEFLLLEAPGEGGAPPASPAGAWKVLCSRARRARPRKVYRFPEGMRGEIVAEEGDQRLVRFDPPVTEEYLERNGHVPLPPYIRRQDCPEDQERYQTVYARQTGSAAAPTAGLHLTEELLDGLRRVGLQTARLTLHVGLGTFLPIRCPRIEEHVMHTERYHVPEETAALVSEAKARGRDVLAVGTTTVRTLESAWDGRRLVPGWGQTSLFIFPGYRFRVVDRLLTNFHTPESSLLLLVAAFAGRENILQAYAQAIARRYRFFSYGDAMLIL